MVGGGIKEVEFRAEEIYPEVIKEKWKGAEGGSKARENWGATIHTLEGGNWENEKWQCAAPKPMTTSEYW